VEVGLAVPLGLQPEKHLLWQDYMMVEMAPLKSGMT
jgi:hypothetical protein